MFDPIIDRMAFERLNSELDHDVLAPVYETIRVVNAQLDPAVALLDARFACSSRALSSPVKMPLDAVFPSYFRM